MVAGDALRDYELVLVLSPEVEDEGISSAIDRFAQMVTGGGGEIKEVNRWGRRKLAYPIKRCVEGHYVVAQLRLQPQQIAGLDASLRLWEEVLRHLLVRVDQ